MVIGIHRNVLARENPFSVDRVMRVRYEPQGWTWEGLIARLAGLNYRPAIVGPHGAGKTTLLEDLAPRLASLGFRPVLLRLSAEFPSFTPGLLADLDSRLGEKSFVLLDGAEQLSPLAWWRFRRRTRRAGGLLVTTHRPGRLPTLVECGTTPALLSRIVHRLVPGHPAASEVGAAALFARHRGNVRDALRELYDECAERTGRPPDGRATPDQSGRA